MNGYRYLVIPLVLLVALGAARCGGPATAVPSVDEPATAPSQERDMMTTTEEAPQKIETPESPAAEPATARPGTDESGVGGETPVQETAEPTPTTGEPRGGPAAIPAQPESETGGAMPSAGAEPPAGSEQVVRLAREDLAQRLGLALEAIEVVSVVAMEWSDTSLGCPQPGMMYAQVITPGFLVALEAGGERYEYHTDEGRFVVLCGENKNPVLPAFPVTPGEIKDGKPWMDNQQ